MSSWNGRDLPQICWESHPNISLSPPGRSNHVLQSPGQVSLPFLELLRDVALISLPLLHLPREQSLREPLGVRLLHLPAAHLGHHRQEEFCHAGGALLGLGARHHRHGHQQVGLALSPKPPRPHSRLGILSSVGFYLFLLRVRAGINTRVLQFCVQAKGGKWRWL